MITNKKMRELLKDIDLNTIQTKNYYSVSERENHNNEKYWIINQEVNCCTPSSSAVGNSLTDLEWSENEIFISNSSDIKEVLLLSLKMFMSLKKILEENFFNTKFDLILSIQEEDDDVPPCGNLRFYAVRDNYRIIDIDNAEEYKLEAILIETLN